MIVISFFLVSRGRPPYPDVGNWDMLPYLRSGRRLPQPDSCPQFLFEIMWRCWDDDPDQRPSFSQLVQEIESETKKLVARAAARMVGLQVAYVNITRGSYYNPSDSDDRGVEAARISSRQEQADGSSAPESGFSSNSNRLTIPRKPAVEPVDDEPNIERAIL